MQVFVLEMQIWRWLQFFSQLSNSNFFPLLDLKKQNPAID